MPMLLSVDIESVILGLTYFRMHPLVQNLNKHYRFKEIDSWPSWSDTIPDHLKGIARGSFRGVIITKQSFEDLEDKTEFNIYLLAYIAICWIASFRYRGHYAISKKSHIKHVFDSYSNREWMKGMFIVPEPPQKRLRGNRPKQQRIDPSLFGNAIDWMTFKHRYRLG